MYGDVQTNGAVRPIIRKKAALCLLRLLRKAGPDSDMLAPDAWSVKLVRPLYNFRLCPFHSEMHNSHYSLVVTTITMRHTDCASSHAAYQVCSADQAYALTVVLQTVSCILP